MHNNYRVWIDKSEENLKWAKDNLKSGNHPLVCYLSQQAVELLLKGYIYSNNKVPPKTHQLIRLAKFSEKPKIISWQKELEHPFPENPTS